MIVIMTNFPVHCFDEMVQMTNGVSDSSDDNENKTQTKRKVSCFTEALAVLCHPEYSLVDAYPALGQVYSIAVVFPITAATAQRSFSALKRVKTRIRSSMVQERLISLLAMVIEHKILLSLNKERLINWYGRIPSELSEALLLRVNVII